MEYLKIVLIFIQEQIFGMKWLNKIIGIMIEKFGIDLNSTAGGVLQFFIYDFIKITFLLTVMMFIISYIQSYFPPERARKILGKYSGVKALTLSALLGTVTPFCSCSSIPLFIGFTSAGLPVGVTFAFLISSPLVDIGSIVLLMSVFGIKITILYVILGLIMAVAGGAFIDKMNMDKYIINFIAKKEFINHEIKLNVKDRISFSKNQTLFTLKKVVPYIIIGVAVGAFIHNFIPEKYVSSVLGGNSYFSVPLSVLVGAPMYADIFGVIPVAESLYDKGAGLGTVMAFMMAVTTLSLPSIIMLKQVVKGKLLVLFIAVVITGIIINGYVFNIVEKIF